MQEVMQGPPSGISGNFACVVLFVFFIRSGARIFSELGRCLLGIALALYREAWAKVGQYARKIDALLAHF